MIRFKPVELSDKAWIDEITRPEQLRSADFVFANIYMWDETFKQQVARLENRLIVKPMYAGMPFYACPVGTGPLEPVIEQMRLHAEAEGFPLTIRGVSEGYAEKLEDAFPGRFEFILDRDYSDYVYPAVSLATLSGKKLHGKRNHINRFLEDNPDWSFERLTPSLAGKCLEMLDNWSCGAEDANAGLRNERNAIVRAFGGFEALGLAGSALYASGRLAAFTIGERFCTDTFGVHFEKADTEVHGAYPMINREFVRHILEEYGDVKYINREDDMGLENLRKAKLSYYPEFLIEKRIAVWRQ